MPSLSSSFSFYFTQGKKVSVKQRGLALSSYSFFLLFPPLFDLKPPHLLCRSVCSGLCRRSVWGRSWQAAMSLEVFLCQQASLKVGTKHQREFLEGTHTHTHTHRITFPSSQQVSPLSLVSGHLKTRHQRGNSSLACQK